MARLAASYPPFSLKLQFCRGKLPFPRWLEWPIALLLSLVPALIVQTDADLGTCLYICVASLRVCTYIHSLRMRITAFSGQLCPVFLADVRVSDQRLS